MSRYGIAIMYNNYGLPRRDRRTSPTRDIVVATPAVCYYQVIMQ